MNGQPEETEELRRLKARIVQMDCLGMALLMALITSVLYALLSFR